MNDAELVREAAELARREQRFYTRIGDEQAAAYYGEQADRLTALAGRLDGGVIVPRVFVEAMRCPNANYEWHERESIPCDWCKRRSEWLTASEEG